MRRLFSVMTVVLISASLSFAQIARDQDDHNDNAPVQAGYAIVTPVMVTTSATTGGTTTSTTTGTSGLVVFETFGLRELLGGALQAGVLPPDLTTNALVFVDHEDRLAKNTGVAIVNPNSTSVMVDLTLRKKDGAVIGTTKLTVPADNQIAKLVSELFPSPTAIPGEITGTLAITSDASTNLPIAAIGLRFRGLNFSTIPATNLSGSSSPLPIIGSAGGPGAVLLPQFVAGGFWASEVIMVNSSTTAMTVRVDLFKQDGSPLTTTLNGQSGSSFTNISIPAGGVAVLAPRDADGDDDF
jgi:hypothetical protein